MKIWQKYPAEFLGTFILVFGGTTALAASNSIQSGSPVLAEIMVPFAFGLALMAGLYAFAEISGGHFNPAVSLGLFLDGRLSVQDLIGYWVFQFAGAITASAVLLVPLNKSAVASTATVPNPAIGHGGAFLFETVFTAIFVSVILESTRRERHEGTALLAIPFTLVAIHFALIPWTGASVNPARTLGPAVVGDKWDADWIYFLGPALGAVIAWLIYSVVVKGEVGRKPKPAPTPPASSPPASTA